jgi:hypothetical protein
VCRRFDSSRGHERCVWLRLTRDGSASDARLRSAFLQHVLDSKEQLDIETAWDLGHVRGFFDVVEIDDDGEVSGMDKAFDSLLVRYPWLADAYEEDEEPSDPALPPKPKTGTGRKNPGNAGATNKKAMQERFPALRDKRRH